VVKFILMVDCWFARECSGMGFEDRDGVLGDDAVLLLYIWHTSMCLIVPA
jgi:hypothetical protein